MELNEFPGLTTLSDNDLLFIQESNGLTARSIKLSTLKQYLGINSAGSESNIRNEILKDNPVGYWSLDEPTGTVANNLGTAMSSGSFSNVVLNQTKLANGSISAALFNSNSSMSFVNTILSNSIDVSLECCINLQSASLSGHLFTLGAADEIGFGIGNGTYSSPGNEFIGIAGNVAWRASGKQIGTGTHHLVMIYKGKTSREWLFYIDGFLVQTLGGVTANVPNNVGVIKKLGVPCILDEVAIYNKALPSIRCLAHANAVLYS